MLQPARSRALILSSWLLACAVCVPALTAAEPVAMAAPVTEGFEQAGPLPAGWSATGAVTSAAGGAYEGQRALRLERTLQDLNTATGATGAAFPATPGTWAFRGAASSALHSPDSSFQVAVEVEALSAAGASLAKRELRVQSGTAGWQAWSSQVELPAGTAQARFVVTMRKTHGWCLVDGLGATPVAGAGPKLVRRIVIGSAVVGNLFLPEQPVALHIDVECAGELPAERRTLHAVVRDYWGAEQGPELRPVLSANGENEGRSVWSADLDLSGVPLVVGRYYELHVTVPSADGGGDREFSGLARLPLAVTKAEKPGDVPFTARNWDNRLKDYYWLADRIGIRQLGVRAEWKAKAPYTSTGIGIDWCQQLDAGWLTTTEARVVEREGLAARSEECLRLGMKDFLTKYADKNLQAICIGNEPPEDPAKLGEKMIAYRAIYEAVKAFDPKITVIGTSVGANEDFFKAGFQNWLDAYDFHVYESYKDVRLSLQRYQAMMKKYDAVKPVHSTEIGLNSQGLPRLAVAGDLIKKVTTFFAAGGATVSWFTIMWPDKDGTARGTSGNVHNVFDAQYARFNPRLDALAFYNMVNGVSVKHVVGERTYADGVQATLFRDAKGRCLQVLWHDGSRVDASVPLPGATAVELLRIDGAIQPLVLRDGAVSLGIGDAPLLLRYDQATGDLPTELAAPALQGPATVPEVLVGGSASFTVSGPALVPAMLRVLTPPGWQAALAAAGDGQVACTVTAPAATEAREGRVQVQLLAGDNVAGELDLGLTLRSPLDLELVPYAAAGDTPAGVALRIRNLGTEEFDVTWAARLSAAYPMAGGTFELGSAKAPTAFLAGEPEGRARLAPGSERRVPLALRDADPVTIHRMQVVLTDANGRRVERARLIGGLGAVPRAKQAPTIDGTLDEALWAAAPSLLINRKDQYYRAGKGKGPEFPWKDADDLSGVLKVAWDDANLYVAVAVRDDVFTGGREPDRLWSQDGLQFLIDPARGRADKAGPYDYAVGVGAHGAAAWCHASPSADVPKGACPMIRVAVGTPDPTRGDRTYELAIPWARLAPFKPGVGADLGLALILNEDDGPGREGFMGWFGGVHLKELDMVGDLILGE